MSLVRNKETIIISRGDERPENNHYNVQVVIGPLSLMVTSKSQYLVKNVGRKKYLGLRSPCKEVGLGLRYLITIIRKKLIRDKI